MTQIIISLPKNCSFTVQKNEKVSAGQLLAVKKGKKQTYQINLSQLLKTRPKKTKNLLLLALGSQVKSGDLIARKKGLLPFKKPKTVRSKHQGILEELDCKTGILTIVKKTPDSQIKAPLSAKIAAISDNKITFEAKAKIIKINKIDGPSVYGLLKTISATTPSSVLEVKNIDPQTIILLKKAPLSVIKKILILGAKGLVITQEMLTEKIKNALADFFTKREPASTICLVEKNTFEILRDSIGKQVYLDSKNSFVAVLN